MIPSFFDRLDARARFTGSLLCVGLDPHPAMLPRADAQAARDECLRLIEATKRCACAFKVNSAFFEVYGAPGWEALKQVIRAAPPEIPVILDAKRGDIASTAAAYARAAFEELGADGLTVSPYLGPDALAPFLAFQGKGVFLLCKTSNPGGDELQTLPAPGGEPLYVHVARRALTWAGEIPIGFVVGATDPEALAEVRQAAPQSWILAPGVGAQGGDLEHAVACAVREDGLGMLVAVSRTLAAAEDPAEEARRLVARIEAARASRGSRPRLTRLAGELVSTGCVVFGEFRLRSGEVSPIYLDLRRMASHPSLLARAAAAYRPLLDAIPFDVLAGIPYAGLPIATALALQTGKPMIYPRREVKDYGTRAPVEGQFRPGDRAVLIDDVVTSGGSKVEAAERLREAGLEVSDVVVMVDRQAGGSASLERSGLRLHSVFTLAGLLDMWEADGSVAADVVERVRGRAGGVEESMSRGVEEGLQATSGGSSPSSEPPSRDKRQAADDRQHAGS